MPPMTRAAAHPVSENRNLRSWRFSIGSGGNHFSGF
jgi:hypothetical protein